MKKFPWFETILIVVVMSVSLYAAFSDPQNFSLRWFTRDDAYYYFKVAQNISEGHGSTFDGINPTNGYHPLWMAICIPIFAFARLDLVLPLRILLLVMSGLSVWTGILLYQLIGKIFTPFIGAIAALYWVLDRNILNTFYKQGLESGIAAFCIVLFLYKLYQFETAWRTKGLTKKELAVLGLIAALTMFSRLDLVFLAGMAGLWIIFRGHALRYCLPLDIIAIIFSVLLAFTVKFGFPAYFENTDAALAMIGVALIVRLPAAYFTGLHQNLTNENHLKILTRVVVFTLISSVLISAVMLVLARVANFNAMPRTILVMDALFSFLLIGATRFIHKDLHVSKNEPKFDSPITVLRNNYQKWLAEGAIYYGIVIGLLGVYMLWNKLAIGTFSPVSGQIKRWWGTFLVSFYGKYPQDLLAFFGIGADNDSAAWLPLAGIFEKWAQKLVFVSFDQNIRYFVLLLFIALIAYLILRLNKKKAVAAITRIGILPLLGSCVLQIVNYNVIGYSGEKEWYWIGEMIVIVLGLSILVGTIFDRIPPDPIKQTVGWSIVGILGLLMGVAFWNDVRTSMPYGRWSPDTPYVDTIPVLETNTEPGSIIGMTGGGTTGYFIHERTIVNMDGLINSEPYFISLQDRTAGEFLYNMGLDYVLANRYILSSQPYKGMYDPYLTETGIEYSGNKLMKYGR